MVERVPVFDWKVPGFYWKMPLFDGKRPCLKPLSTSGGAAPEAEGESFERWRARQPRLAHLDVWCGRADVRVGGLMCGSRR